MKTAKLTAFEIELIAQALKSVARDETFEHSTRQTAARLRVQFEMAKEAITRS